MINPIFIVLLFSFLMSACSIIPDWLGGDDDKKLKGERHAVLAEAQNLQADAGANDIQVTLPALSTIAEWFNPSLDGSYQGNLEGYDHYSVKEKVSIGHSPSRGYPLLTTPVIAEQKVFSLSAGGYVSAHGLDNPRHELWGRYLLPGKKHSIFSGGAITYDQGRLYITTGTEKVFALKAADGIAIWERALSTPIRSAPAVDKHTLYVLSTDNKAFALRKENGTILWSHIGLEEQLGVSSWASMLVDPETNLVFAPYSSGEIFGLRLNNGIEAWSDSVAGSESHLSSSQEVVDIPVTPILNDGRLYTISHGGMTTAHDSATGNRLWDKDISSQQAGWLAGEFLYMIDDKSNLLAIHTPSGLIKWTKQLPRYLNPKKHEDLIYWSNPLLINNQLRILGSHGKMMNISPLDGNLIDIDSIPDDIQGAAISVNKNIFYITGSADLIILSGKK